MEKGAYSMGVNNKKTNEEILEEELNRKLAELGIARTLTCDHEYEYTAIAKPKGEFFKIKRIYTCVKCGAIFTVTWCEHR